MSKEWKHEKLGDICRLVGGGTPAKSIHDYYTGEIPWATVRDMRNEVLSSTEHRITKEAVKKSSTNIIPKGNVIIATRVGLGKVCLIDQDTAINQDLRGIIPLNSNKLDVRFLFWWMKSIAHQIEEEGTGATVKGVKLTFVQSLQAPLPSLPEQKRIVTILNETFKGIDKAIANAEKNLANAHELFESYLNSVFSQKGEGWVERKLSELGKITSSKRIYKNEYTETGIPFYRTKEIKELANGREVTTELFISYDRYHEIIEKFGAPNAGDVLMTAIGTIGEIYVVETSDKFYFKDGNVLWLKNFKGVEPYFLKFALRSFVEKLQRLSHGSAYNALPIEKLKEHALSVPSKEEQKLIIKKISTLQNETKRLEVIYQKKLAALAEMKQSLLQKAFAGELTADDVIIDKEVFA